ncbi:MAG: VIT1/CCC1 transporter family protein [Thermodesulfobacterium sp.]|nr:VIT1/CCC1 transporter family protein [Thermodesulfobacterium sp.]
MKVNAQLVKLIEKFQKTEVTEQYIYTRLAKKVKDQNQKILLKIAEEESKHARVWAKYTGKRYKPNRIKAFLYLFIAWLFGFTFAIKLMERGEKRAEENYEKLIGMIPEAQEILHEEEVHERELANLLNEERLNYISSMILGLNDALVELTGALAGLTFALQNTKLTGITSFIIGISAAFSMSASEYLSTRSEGDEKSPLKAAFYTGVAYLMTVIILVWPYFVFSSYILAFGVALLGALTIILVFTFFVSVVQERSFLRFFLEMFFVSFGVAVFSFSVGILARKIFNVEV